MLLSLLSSCLFFFFNDTATTEIYTLSLHDAFRSRWAARRTLRPTRPTRHAREPFRALRSEEHTSELQSQFHLVCRLLLEKKTLFVLRAAGADRSAGAAAGGARRGCGLGEDMVSRVGDLQLDRLSHSVNFFFKETGPPRLYLLPLPRLFPH